MFVAIQFPLNLVSLANIPVFLKPESIRSIFREFQSSDTLLGIYFLGN